MTIKAVIHLTGFSLEICTYKMEYQKLAIPSHFQLLKKYFLFSSKTYKIEIYSENEIKFYMYMAKNQ